MGKLFLILLLTAGLFPALFAREKTQEEEKDPYKNISVFMHSIQILREKYVDKETPRPRCPQTRWAPGKLAPTL